MARVNYDKQSALYDKGRSLPPEAIAVWMATARRHIGDDPQRILDLGSGTGRFSAPLAGALDALVIAVEPSGGMRTQAAGKPHPHVHLTAGAAEAIPLAAGCCDAAWLSNVMHHFDDIELAARELRRVIVDDGPVLIRGAFADRGPIPTLYRFFPGTERSIESFPTAREIIGVFEATGFTSFSVEKVEYLLAYRLTDMVERIRRRADTTLELLSDEEFEAGLHALEEVARTDEGPVMDSLD
ncbi:MAG: class I SAM-dependent methyltransferase, partial [Candidatus Binatia bacterium]